MKRLLLISILFALFVGFSSTSYGQILDNPPQELIYQDYDKADIRPVPYPSLRKADLMWSKRMWREIDMRQKIN